MKHNRISVQTEGNGRKTEVKTAFKRRVLRQLMGDYNVSSIQSPEDGYAARLKEVEDDDEDRNM